MQRNKIRKTISVGETQTDSFELGKYSLSGFILTGSVVTGSQVSFLVSGDGTNFVPLFDSTGTEVTVPVGAVAGGYNVDNSIFNPFYFIKLRLGESGSSVAQQTYNLGVDFLLISDN